MAAKNPRATKTILFTSIVFFKHFIVSGKSLLFSINQNLLYGRQLLADKHISDAMMYKKLNGLTEEGRVPVYGISLYFFHKVLGIV